MCPSRHTHFTTDDDGNGGFSDSTRGAEAVLTGNSRAGRPTVREGVLNFLRSG